MAITIFDFLSHDAILVLNSFAFVSCASHFSAIGAHANRFASTYYTKITPAVLHKSKTINYDYA